ncbi:MAG: hypothetical protein ACC655_03275, partial [Rhodothermia bacterium]
PFFYKFDLGLPSPFGLLSVMIVLVVGVLTTTLVRHRRYAASRFPLLRGLALIPRMRILLVIFFSLGVGFMLLEIAFFQKMTLYMEQPILALTVLLFTLLLGTGLGSLCSSFVKKHLVSALASASLITMTLTLVYTIYFPELFEIGLDPRVTAALFLFPLGLFLGVPFPLAIRLMKEEHLDPFVDSMWGVNGIASVVGSALAMIVGIMLGFSYALYIGALLYGVVSLLGVLLTRPFLQEEAVP